MLASLNTVAPSGAYLHGQTQGVEHDEDEHDVLEASGVHHVPELVLVWVLGDVPEQRPGLEGIFHTLALLRRNMLLLVI